MKAFPITNNAWRFFFVSLSFLFATITTTQATHLRAGDIVVERESCGSRRVKITITVYTNTGSTVRFGGEQDVLNFGDGTWEYVPTQENQPRPDLDADGSVATASYVTYHTYPSTGTYLISYREPNRNEGVLNMDGSINTTFYIETVFKIDAFLGCNDSPRLLVPPIDHACTGAAWTHNPGAYDPNRGDSISYSMAIPFKDRRTTVINYRDPNHPSFYTNYNTANEAGNGPPIFSINPVTGTITWDAPGARGEYNIAFHIIEWRKRNGTWYQMGYVRRDMQILVDDCENKRPDLILPADTCVVAGTILDATIFGIDPDNDNVKIEAFSEIFNFPPNQFPATYSPVPGVNDFQPSVPPAELEFQWQTECLHVKEQPYQVVFKITDDPPPGKGARLVTFKTWFIRVVGPPPEWEAAELNANNTATLEWDPYFCQNAERMQVWRKVDGVPFEPANCETGMPEHLNYELITELSIKDANQVPITNYLDTNSGLGLAPGARYCYRLVAVFPVQGGGESYVSKDTCVGPVPADVPIMTHVSITKTDASAGEIRVSWLPPFDIDTTGLTYALYRAVGSVRGMDSVLVVGNLRNRDTTFLDTGLNTLDNMYNYSVTAFDAGGTIKLGSSFPASSVRLTAQSQVGQIQLTWNAFVPWSNQIRTLPNKHLIYRGVEGAPEDQFVLIDEVDVLSDGFVFVDEGQHGELVQDQTYCYRIMTRGGYGNPAIGEPLNNFSQIICAQLGDTIPPCKPTLLVEALNCEEHVSSQGNCNETDFRNTIYWTRNREDGCDTNILGYKVYRSRSAQGDFMLITPNVIQDTVFIDRSVNSYAYCYKISAVDRSLNESELSDAVCNDNCPYYELPNVFTPDNDNCNDLFSAYSDRSTGEETKCPISVENRNRCARFVESVSFRVYNRWGQQVYSYEGSSDDDVNSIYIDWNGKDSGGTLLPSGVYYYVAEVTFNVVTQNKTKIIKGWVHLIR